MKKILTGVLIAALLGIAVFFSFGNKENEIKYRTEKAARGDIISTVTATGTVNAVTTVLVGTQVSGTIKNIYADFNSPVKKGQAIALIDPATFEAQVAQARANLLSAKANEDKSEAALADAKRTMDRNRELLSKNLIARSDLDTAETNYETAKAQVGVSKAQVAQTEAALRIAETNLGYTKILSPVDGVVISRNVDIGQTVAASFQTPTLFTIAQDLTKMQIDTNVDEADIGNMKVGQDVEFTVDAYPDITFKGMVSQVRNSPIIVENVVTYDVVVKVDNPDLKLKPGMTANVSIVLQEKRDVIRLPNAALRFSPAPEDKGRTQGQQREKGPGVWILKDRKATRVPVKTGISNGSYTELVSGDIREGQEVIVDSLVKQQNNSQPPRLRM
ncbi:MAG TPA: efflux RND transporter periplasmic adaptor subunit [Nitrospiraceae bacterium]|nr:efflux RND transporter periplasmic adaptor subunit [Nitrospiraceae bacterium]